MSKTNIEITGLKQLFLEQRPLIDVRAPIEFTQGSLPGAVNLPILNDEERALIGTLYKNEGQAAAVSRGYQIVSGALKQERLEKWMSFIAANPKAILFCFRGGKRSQITQQWLKEAGVERPLIIGGYKRTRQWLIDSLNTFSNDYEFLSLTGPTGSGKTQLIKRLNGSYPVIDLENLAKHRGSAFGQLNIPQPSQIDFENQLAVELIKIESKNNPLLKPLIEDESRLIGQNQVPEGFFNRLRSSSVIWLDEPFEVRLENIYREYILETAIGSYSKKTESDSQEKSDKAALDVFSRYKKSVHSIQKKLGGLRTQEILSDIAESEIRFQETQETSLNKIWIEKLLKYYYDPMYLGSLERRAVKIEFKGNAHEVAAFLSQKISK